MMSLIACGTGFVLDFLFGDPIWLYHPVRLIGALIAWLEKLARKVCGENRQALLTAGVVLWIIVVSISTAVPYALLYAAGVLHPAARFVLESFWCYQLLAAKSLKLESMKVYDKIKNRDLEGARRAVSMIVGRDTESLDEEGVVKAAVETVAENTSDGVTAPLLFLMIGGAPLGFFYKAVNTMDSMIGYKDEKYLYLGRCAAKLDDVLNYLPARLSAVLMTLAAYLLKMDGHGAWRIYLRDRRKHASPNSAQTEAVCAGALGIRLAGDAYYFGKLYKKEYIGDATRPVEAEDIKRADRLMYGTAVLTFVVFGIIRLAVLV
ncbi:adenosylcobinamide-phosphate synthase CbiB [Faecalicatena sp. AGMB00832]|uniref:Cobalamin biosynthesis protein CobD n=1 Tax=Faecalicatena faecalis TaxID=2726362 RepID=A0ABS6D3F2_9FIRM|nr:MULTISPECIES: adenosylcobinamide-phosphate synthase CbiB [Faecalicatena]MBU3876029.1 adenosylcobinamide-phosphate synthase CbiB [Faecalicatena faecalis]MCI6468260.1 adenosylcobinamide-phosphate synthase CbiB [Faecalicatena sp.]MDY5620514.1 adenosylcobinamide-phosphate synthase CbiB [Lachnospiraceae bacterium]